MTVAAFLLCAASAAAQHWSGCRPLPENMEAYSQLINDPEFRQCRQGERCWDKRQALIQRIVKKSPDDIVFGVMLQALREQQGPEEANKMRKEARERAKKQPKNPAALFLAAMAATDPDEALRLFAEARTYKSDFAAAHFQIALRLLNPHPNQNQQQLVTRYGTVLDNVSRIMWDCPEEPGYALLFYSLGDENFWKAFVDDPAATRAAIARAYGSDNYLSRYVNTLALLWELEARLSPEEAAKLLLKDLQDLESRGDDLSLEALSVMMQGYRKLGNLAREEFTGNRILAQFGCSAIANRIRVARFWNGHGRVQKSFDAMSTAEAQAYYDAFRESVYKCPEYGFAGFMSALYRLGMEGQLSATELKRDRIFVSAHWNWVRLHTNMPGFNNPDYVFAAIRLRSGAPLDIGDADSLRRFLRDRSRWQADEAQQAVLKYSPRPEQDRLRNLQIQVQASSDLVRVLSVLGKVAEARHVLAGLDESVFDLTASLDTAPGYMRQGLEIALSHYWRAVAAAVRGWDRYAYLTRANSLQPGTGPYHDPGLTAAAALMAGKLAIPPGSIPDRWQGSSRGRSALAQIGAFPPRKILPSTGWKRLDPPLQLPDIPQTTVKDLAGASIKMTTLAGENDVIVVNFWATWCVPCQAEMPRLAKVSVKTKVPIYMISIDKQETEVRLFLSRQNFVLPNVLLGENFFEFLSSNDPFDKAIGKGIPQTLIIRGRQIIAVSLFDASIPEDLWVENFLLYLEEISKK